MFVFFVGIYFFSVDLREASICSKTDMHENKQHTLTDILISHAMLRI